MQACPVCFSQVKDQAVKCPKCLTFIKPRVNEGQFWGAALMIGGILLGAIGYIWYLVSMKESMFLFMRTGIILAYVGFLVYGFGTFLSWFLRRNRESQDTASVSSGKKQCFYCGEEIDQRAIKCNVCMSYQRQEKGKILATFIVVSGILILTTAYIMLLAQNLQSEIYMQLGILIIILGVLMFLYMVIRGRYSARSVS